MKEKKNRSETIGLFESEKSFLPHALVYSDGLYHLFFGRASFPSGFSKCSASASGNLLDWGKSEDILVPDFFRPVHICSGSAIQRNGRIWYVYLQKTLFSDVIRLAATSDLCTLENYPLPVISKKTLPKKVRRIGAPRIFRSGENYYIVSGSRSGTLLFQSQNLMDWHLKGTLTDGISTDFASLVQSGNHHILFEMRGGVFGCRYGRLLPEEGVFVETSRFMPLDCVLSPRITTLPDGRLLLVSGLLHLDGRCSGLALPKEIHAGEDGLCLRPVRELLQKRKGEISASFSAGETTATYAELSGKRCEILLKAHLTKAKSFTARLLMTGCRGLFITFNREKGEVDFDVSTLAKDKNYPPVAFSYSVGESVELRVILLPGRAECFIDDGIITFSRGFDDALAGCATGFDANGDAFCEAIKYDLEDPIRRNR
jgi:sucrose-6-phosphate hydrolase SacC (GH32 family)